MPYKSLGRYSQKWGIQKKVNLVSTTLKKYLASKIFHHNFSSLQTAIGTRPFSLIPQISSCELFQINLKYQNTSQYIHQFYSLQWIKLNNSWQNKLVLLPINLELLIMEISMVLCRYFPMVETCMEHHLLFSLVETSMAMLHHNSSSMLLSSTQFSLTLTISDFLTEGQTKKIV